MADNDKGEPTEQQTGYIPAQGTHGAHISEDDANAARAAQDSAEKLGVDQASFDKYYSKSTATFNWQAYAQELEFKAQQRAKAEPESTEAESEAPQQTQDEGQAQGAVEQAGLDWDTLGEKISANGDIDAADYEALAAIGVPREIAEGYIGMVKGQAEQLIVDVHRDFGGEAEFNRVYDALEGVEESKLEAIDDLLRDPSSRQAGIAAAYAAAGLAPGNSQQAPAAPAQRGAQNAAPAQTSAQGFASFEDQVSAMRDSRYYTDPQYRAEVLERVRNSTYDYNPRQHTSGL